MPSPPSPPVGQAVLLNGKPFPPASRFEVKLPAPRRTFFAAAGNESGDGSANHPWNDLQAALCALGPGDRLRVGGGKYPGGLRLAEACRDGEQNDPVQVVFDGKAKIGPGGEAAALTIRRTHWILVSLVLDLKESPGPGVSIEGPGGSHVTLDGARIAGGTGPGVRIGPGVTHVTVSNARISRKPLARGGPSAFGIEIAAETAAIRVIRNHLSGNPAGSIRVDAPVAGGRAAHNLVLRGNAVRDDGATSIAIEAARGLRIEDNVVSDSLGREGARGIVLGQVRDVSVRRNQISGFAAAIQVGRASPDDKALTVAEDVTIDRNFLEGMLPDSVGVDIEAGNRVRVANNVVDGYATGILVFGAPPQTQSVRVANNLFLRLGDVAFALATPETAILFDYNIFSARSGAPSIQIGANTRALADFLAQGTMPHSRLVPAAQILNRDLMRVSGAELVDAGVAISGIESKGQAPDIGVAER